MDYNIEFTIKDSKLDYNFVDEELALEFAFEAGY